MHITRLGINNLPPLDHVGFDCDERVNLFVGPNASGKSTILWVINRLAMNEMATDEEEDEEEIETSWTWIRSSGSKVVYITPSEDWPWYDYGQVVDIREDMPLLYIPATRVSPPRFKFPDVIIDTVQDPEANTPLDNLFDTQSGIFNGYYVELAIRWLGDRNRLNQGQLSTRRLSDYIKDDRNRLNRDQQNQLRRVLDIGYSCAKRICDEVLRDNTPHPFIEIDKASSSERIVHHGMGIGTNDDVMGEPLHASVLSSGTQGTLLWIYALALKMASHYGWEEGWDKKPAILLIDEIENHLHPTWQRRVIPALLEYFPSLQIFATTHSPFVVASREAGQVHLLKRDENGRVTATTNTEDIVGWTADEILRTMLGVPDPTDERTANAAQELRRLRKEWPRDTPEKEEERQQRMRELRELVDRDLLAGGPMARQREIFEQQFAEALRKYQESQSLNQENGPPSAQ